MIKSGPLRVVLAALALTTLSFAAGVAGDLSMIDPPRSGVSVVLRIPPELPADTPRAAPLPPLGVTPASAVQPLRRAAIGPAVVAESGIEAPERVAAPKPVSLAAVAPKPQAAAIVTPRKHKISYV